MKDHILDLLIVENNKEHFIIWSDYFSTKYKIQIQNTYCNKGQTQTRTKIGKKIVVINECMGAISKRIAQREKSGGMASAAVCCMGIQHTAAYSKKCV